MLDEECQFCEPGYICSIEMKNCAADVFDYDVCMCIILCASFILKKGK